MGWHSFSPALALNITDVEKFEVGKKTDRVGKKLTGYFFLPGKRMTSQFLPQGRNGLARSFAGEILAGGKTDRYTGTTCTKILQGAVSSF